MYAGSVQLPADVKLYRDNELLNTFRLNSKDTLLYLDTFLPKRKYRLKALVESHKVTSPMIEITTLDTTSHEFSWQMWKFGGE